MPNENKKNELRTFLTSKTTKELETLLVLDFTEDKDTADPTFIATVLEVIEEREPSNKKRTLEAWNEFQEYCKQRDSSIQSEVGETEQPNLGHQCKTRWFKRTRKNSAAWKTGIAAAAVLIILCNTALGWNIFQVIAEWTEDTFWFLIGESKAELPKQEVLELFRIAVSDYTDVAVVPCRAPEGTKDYGNLSINELSDQYIIGTGYTVNNRSFSIRIVIYKSMSDIQVSTYQKDAKVCEKHVVNGIVHYITENNEKRSAMWVNGCVEGHIQGDLTIEELRQMIDSIYED